LVLTKTRVEWSLTPGCERIKEAYKAFCTKSTQIGYQSGYWLELIIDGGLMAAKRVTPLLMEADELTQIMASSRVSAARRRATRNRQSEIGNRQ
jgi:hypothetical protein